MQVDEKLLRHPFWQRADLNGKELVVVSRPFPPFLNPFHDRGVVMRAAGVPGSDKRHSKEIVGHEGIRYCIEQGLIHQLTKVFEATSANTGDGMAEACHAIGVHYNAIYNFDIPRAKGREMAKGRRPYVHLLKHSDPHETSVERARRLGARKDCCNPDQYGPAPWNSGRQKVMAMQWFQKARMQAGGRPTRIAATPAGTMGTSIGAQEAAHELGQNTLVVPVMVAAGEEWPGGRTRSRIERDVRNGWEKRFVDEHIEYAPRYHAFNLSYKSRPFTPSPLAASFGGGFYGALKFLHRHFSAGTEGQFRDPEDGNIYVDIFGPDGTASGLYDDIYPAVLKYEDMADPQPVSLEQLFGP